MEDRFLCLIVDTLWEMDIRHAKPVRDDDGTFFVEIIAIYERRSFF